MFYDHEVLTSRKYGIATIWLVATLGSKSSLKKINRRTILEVNIFKACGTIVTPEVPMALRLQSNLLYGISRVYDQQCSFVLSEAQSVQNDLKRAVRTVPRLELDAEARKAARPEQLLLQDDPTFLPDLAFANLELDLDIGNLGLTTDDSSQGSSRLSPHTPPSSQSSNGFLPQIIIPSSGSGRVSGIGDYGIDDSRPGRMSGIGSGGMQRFGEVQEGFLDDLGFAFDGDGNLVQDTVEQLVQKESSVMGNEHTVARRESSLLAHVRQEHEDAQAFGVNFNNDVDMDYMPPLADEYAMHPDAEPFPARPQPDPQLDHNVPHPSSSGQIQQDQQDEESAHSAEAPSRRTRQLKILKPDPNIQLTSAVMRDWNTNYISNMMKAAAHRTSHREPLLAKKRAEHWVWTMGIGGIGGILADTNIPTPLDIFYGDKLFATLTGSGGPDFNPLKRDHSSIGDESSDSEGRRVRSKSNNSLGEMGRANGDADMDMGGFQAGMDDQACDVEIGRNAPTPLPGDLGGDASSIMPWNRSASQHSAGFPGSAIPFNRPSGPLSRRVSISSVTPLQAGPFSRHSVSASPLLGHGLPHSRRGSLAPIGAASSLAGDMRGSGGVLGDSGGAVDELDVLNSQEEFELFGPAANTDTQTAGQSQWVKQVLDHESVNFLEFVETSLAARQEQEQPSDVASRKKAPEISFEALLNPTINSKVVAAQALLHCLTLATKNMLKVHQDEGYGEILLALVGGHRCATVS